MTIPPFPSQDLAKLVLGYLAEEQLMTAYDEFLQASPYLDALRNEYDRIFMTSLKNILAEYRAVKIYVETCKPFSLRKRLVQCTNLLDVVKSLVHYADVSKLQSQDCTSDRVGLSKQTTATKQSYCEVCNSLNLASCVCNSKNLLGGHSTSNVDTSTLESSVETTALEDLPGNHVTTRKKHLRVIEKDSILQPHLISTEDINQTSITFNTSDNGFHCNSQTIKTKSNDNSSISLSSMVKVTDTPECREKIEEFNNILNKVCNNKSNADTRLFSVPESDTLGSRVSNASFQDFATAVSGHENRNIPVPDSSTSENLGPQTYKDNTRDFANTSSEFSKDVNEHSGIQPSNTCPYPRIKPKPNEQKIKILSDIKVDSPFTSINTATSTPLMQTIVINGTPAYKHQLPMANNSYTKDEIMAMPTIIVVPTSGTTQKLTQTQPVLSQKIKKAKSKVAASKKVLGPLVIDVSSSPISINNKDTDLSKPTLHLQSAGIENGLVRTVDVTKNASVPKDNTISGSIQTNTPQVLPPIRKSSSTPRRNSHIRVLDFTTPRRILHETIHEKVHEGENNKPVEIVLTGSPNIVFPQAANCSNNIIDMSAVKVHKIETCHINNKKETKEKKSNWDADLRTLAIANEKVESTVKKPKKANTKKKSGKGDTLLEKKSEPDDQAGTKKSRGKRKGSPKNKKTKRRKLEEEEEKYNELAIVNDTKVTVKPTFNIIAADVRNSQHEVKASEIQSKSNDEGANETPESERISLQNEIGVKLNISDLLETPYKQALYDIQMETPKFLGSVLPDEPISDIKIMNIPTPRFFDTPKPTQATPSYSSRTTDYSSGGSYYKPDEQDYLRIPDLECPVTSSKVVSYIDSPKENDNKRSSRPIRNCTKNVSYKDHTIKSKGSDNKGEMSSTSTTSLLNSSSEISRDVLKIKTPKDSKSRMNLKSETKKKFDSAKKRKTPVKKDKLNTFMKIKPRRPTPTKENNRTKRKTATLLKKSPKPQNKKTNIKDKTDQITPVVVSAPTKSRRKSSTPRKLHCTKQFNSESSADSPEMNLTSVKIVRDPSGSLTTPQSHDSDTEQLALRWSDDGSQDAKSGANECEDISKIKQYIESSVSNKIDYVEAKGTLQVDLIKRGFDAETAKIIERDLLDTPDIEQNCQASVQIPDSEQNELSLEKNKDLDTNTAKNLQLVEETEEEDDFELSIYECNEESDNYVIFNSETKDMPKGQPVTLREAWSMEVCIEDGEPIRLRATPFNLLFDNVPQNVETNYSFRETEVAVGSILNIDKLYTPLKDRRTQCYEIFDSTLTSLDTPLKVNSPKQRIHEITEIEIVVEEESGDNKDTDLIKLKKKCESPEESSNESKRAKPEAQYLFNSTNIQNIDIESVLKKLHGP